MALYHYSFKLNYTGANATVRALIDAINLQLGPIQMDVDDTQIAAVRTQLTNAGLQPVSIQRVLVVNPEVVP